MQLRLSPTRTLTELRANVQDIEIRDALQHFTVIGPLGSLLDAEDDCLGDGRFLRSKPRICCNWTTRP